jgi:hypothetical protein
MEEKMRKLVMIGFAWLLLMAGIAIPAMADVNVYADINKDKDIIVGEWLYKLKLVYLTVTVTEVGDKAAESLALVNQENEGNTACENCAEKTSDITSSVKVNEGITNVNQSTGNMNNQGNVVSVAVDNRQENPPPQQPGVPGASGFAEAQASVEQDNHNNQINSVNILYRNSLIYDSVNDNTGITNVNQAAGQMNNQANATSLAVCRDGSVALSEADLGQAISGLDSIHEDSTVKLASIESSVLGNEGVTFVNQSSGNYGNQSNTLSLAVAIHQ